MALGINNVDFVKFADLVNNNNSSNGWTVVTIHDELDTNIGNGRKECFSIYSKLVMQRQEYLEIEFSLPEWISGWEHMKSCSEDKAKFEPRTTKFEDTIMVKEFFCECGPNAIHLDLDFLDTYNLKSNDDKSVLKNVDNEPIVKYEDRKIVKIRTDYLRDYLEKNDSYLVRSYDCFRKSTIPPSELIGLKRDEIPHLGHDKRFKNTIVEFKEHYDVITLSRLLGKNVIFPQKLFGT